MFVNEVAFPMNKATYPQRLSAEGFDQALLISDQLKSPHLEINRTKTDHSEYALVRMYSPFSSKSATWFRIYRKLNDSEKYILIVDFIGHGEVGELKAEKRGKGAPYHFLQILDKSGSPWFAFTDKMWRDP